MEIVRPFFLLLPLAISIAITIAALYWRFKHSRSLDVLPNITPITPSTVKKFGGAQNIVRTGLYINQFQQFDMMQNNFIFNGVVWFEFNHATISLDTLEKFTIEKGDIIKRSPPESQIIEDKLLVRYAVTVKFTSSLDYQDFPFDSHELCIYLALPSVAPSEIIFDASLNEFQVAPVINTHGWLLTDKKVIAGYGSAELESYQKEKTFNYPAVVFTLTYRRSGIRFVLMIILPIMFVFYLSLFSFSVQSANSSMSIVIGSISSILTYRYVIEKLSPETGYFLISDYLFFLYLFGSFFVFLCNTIENFIFTEASLTQKKITIILINTLMTLITVHILILQKQRLLSLLKHLVRWRKKRALNTIADMQAFISSMPEYPPMDNEDLQNPQFVHFYTRFLSHPMTYLLASLYGNKVDDTPDNFVKLLSAVTKQREQTEHGDEFITLISLEKPARFVVWDDLHASFHSLYRSMTWLKENKYINNDFALLDDTTYLVFNGDCIDRGAYNLDTLSVILKLMQINPNRVFYTRGLHEHGAYWQNYTLKQELSVRARWLSSSFIPLDDLFLRFFNTLPRALYINFKEQPTDVLRISNHPGFAFDEMMSGTFFSAPQAPITHLNLANLAQAPQKINVKAVIKAEDWLHENKSGQGLDILDQDQGATAWAVTSARTKIMQEEYKFHYDAFVVLHVKMPLVTSSITLVNRTIVDDEPFKEHQAQNIITGGTSITTAMKSEIRLGSSMALKGGTIAFVGKSIQDGITANINAINKDGGINGHPIKIIIYNDDYTPHEARQNINRLLQQDETDVIVFPVGGLAIYPYMELIRNNTIALLFPLTGGQQFREPSLTSVINLRASAMQEVDASISYLCDTFGVNKFAFFYQDDPFEPVDVAHQILKQKGINTWTDIPYLRESTDFTKQVTILKEAQPDAIGFFASAFATQECIRQIGVENLANKKLFAFSLTAEDSLRTFVKQHGIDMLFSSLVPNPHTSPLEIVKEYRIIMDNYRYSYNAFSLESYIGMNLLIEMLKRIGNPPFSKERILKELESLNNYQFKGLTFTFNAEQRSLSQSVWLEIEPEWREITWKEFQASAPQ